MCVERESTHLFPKEAREPLHDVSEEAEERHCDEPDRTEFNFEHDISLSEREPPLTLSRETQNSLFFEEISVLFSLLSLLSSLSLGGFNVSIRF
jgi:hypothetical protein